MIMRLHKKEANGILCWKLDRLARNPVDGGSITWLLQQGIIEEIVTPEKVYHSTDNVILMGVEFGMANQFVIDLSKIVKRGMNSKIEKGWLPTKAPIGYKNEVHAEKGNKRILVDPETFPLIQKLWKRLLRNQLSLAELYEVMRKEFPLYRKGELIAFSSFYRVFHSSFYAGIFMWNGERHVGSHPAMISVSEFERAQEILESGTSLRQGTLEFDLKGLFSCGHCGGQITAERHKKREKSTGVVKEYDYYHCSHRKKGLPCTEQALSKKALLDQIVGHIERCEIPEDILRFGLAEIARMDGSTEESDKEKVLKREIVTIDQKLKNALDKFVNESDREMMTMLKTTISELKIDRKRKEGDLIQAKQKRNDPLKEIKNSLELIIQLKKTFLHGEADQKKRILTGLGLNWEIQSKNLAFKPRFTIAAVQKSKILLSGEYARFEPTQTRIGTTKNPPSADLILIWSG